MLGWSTPGRGNVMHKAAESGAYVEWSMGSSVARVEESKRRVEGGGNRSVMGKGSCVSHRGPGRSLILRFYLNVV